MSKNTKLVGKVLHLSPSRIIDEPYKRLATRLAININLHLVDQQMIYNSKTIHFVYNLRMHYLPTIDQITSTNLP